MCSEIAPFRRRTISQWRTYVQEWRVIDACQKPESVHGNRVGGRDSAGELIEVQADTSLINNRNPSILSPVPRPRGHLVWLWSVESFGDNAAFHFRIMNSS